MGSSSMPSETKLTDTGQSPTTSLSQTLATARRRYTIHTFATSYGSYH